MDAKKKQCLNFRFDQRELIASLNLTAEIFILQLEVMEEIAFEPAKQQNPSRNNNTNANTYIH